MVHHTPFTLPLPGVDIFNCGFWFLLLPLLFLDPLDEERRRRRVVFVLLVTVSMLLLLPVLLLLAVATAVTYDAKAVSLQRRRERRRIEVVVVESDDFVQDARAFIVDRTNSLSNIYCDVSSLRMLL